MTLFKQALAFNSSRHRLRQENEAFARQVLPHHAVLDAGAGSAPYRDLFSHAQYETADFEQVEKKYAPSTYVCDLSAIPVEDSRFDFVVFNQVLEHLPEPKLVLKELFRVLKPGGKMIYTGPLFYEEHEVPYDFFRYTQYGLRYLLEGVGFEVQRLDWLEGYFGTVGYQLNRMHKYLPTNPKEFGGGVYGVGASILVRLFRAVACVMSIVFHRLEMRSKFSSKGYPKNYVAIVTKPVL
jgi:SAM-dependent methyltransferase